MIDLKEFRQKAEPAVWSRGKAYFNDGAVVSLENDGSFGWEAIVSGNDDYEVSIVVQFGRIQEWYCDCPYDGYICKHVVASALAIDEKTRTSHTPIQENGDKPKKFEELLNSVSTDELRRFVLQHAKSDKSFKRAFQVSFAEKNPAGGKAQYAKLITQSLLSAMGRHGYIDYRSTGIAFSTVYDLLNKATELQNKGNYNEAWLIVSAVVEQVSEVTGAIDDSDGVISDTFEDAFTLISDLTANKEVPIPFKEQMFDWHKTEYLQVKYKNYGADSILYAMNELAEVLDRTAEVIPLLDSAMAKTSSDYELLNLLQQKAGLLKSLGRTAEYASLVNENMKHPEFRKIKLDELLKLNQYNEAEKLIEEGIRISEEQKHYGTSHQWKEHLLEIYQKTK